MLLISVCTLMVINIPYAFAQSNYASQANNVEYRGDGLPEEATLDGKVSIIISSTFMNIFKIPNLPMKFINC